MVVRADLPRGLQTAQVVHAAGESGSRAGPAPFAGGHVHAVCLTVPGEDALRAVAARLDAAGALYVSVVESDAPYEGQLMALGCMPAPKEVMRRCLSALPLLR